MLFADHDEEIAEGLALQEATVADLAAAMTDGRLTAVALAERYLDRIERLDRRGPSLRSVIEVNPDAVEIAARLDAERRERGARGPLHGVPVLLKDNIDTHDRMQTSAGSLALVGEPAPQDATVAALLRRAGAVILGKANLSEWANHRSTHSSSGWSGRGGQCRNPYVLDRNPCGSSSGSAAAVSANLCAVSLGTETDGSIVCPSSASGVAGIKPTVGLVSRAGVVPISHSQDTVGPHGRTVADAAAVLGALAGEDPRDPQTVAGAGQAHGDYTRFLVADGLRGTRIGVARTTGFGRAPKVDAIMEEAIRALRDAGATVVDPADIPTQKELGGENETTVLQFEFKQDLARYLSGRTGVPIRTLADAIEFNRAHAAEELPWFGQERFEQAEATTDLTDPRYLEALAQGRALSRDQGIDAVLAEHRLDALVAPTGGPAWVIDLVDGDRFTTGSSTAAAQAGYPIVTVPAGFSHGLPVGLSFIGRAWSEPTLIRLAYAFERWTRVRRRPQFLPTIELPAGTAG
ncbi:MAG TPA: amidase [Terriglobales bacterium]|nr:amidase [Terriglobales bacterium]